MLIPTWLQYGRAFYYSVVVESLQCNVRHSSLGVVVGSEIIRYFNSEKLLILADDIKQKLTATNWLFIYSSPAICVVFRLSAVFAFW